jgi:hypothetical protein
MLENTPLNAKPREMYRSYTADVLKGFGRMVDDLMAA